MSEPPVLAPARPRASGHAGRPPREAVFVPALALVIGFWWIATGLVVAIQRDPTTRAGAAVAAAALAVAGVWLMHSRRHDTTPAGARRSLIGGALLWAWVSASFYGGWIVGPGIQGPLDTAGPSLALALEAIRATSHNEVASLACLAVAWAASRGGRNRLGFQVLLVFWAMHQLARINIFLGVVNPATRFLPDRLLWLTEFFGPARNSPLLGTSVLLLSVAAVLLFRRARHAPEPFRRHSAALLGILVALGALEHLLLGTSWDAPLWDAFLSFRG